MVLSPLITTPYISRVLQADRIGIYSYTFTIATAFSLFAALGVNVYGQRGIAYCGDNKELRSKTFWELFFIRVITTSVIGVIYIVFSFNYSDYSIYLLAQSFIVFGTMLDISWLYQGIEEFKLIAIRNVIIKIITIALIFILVKDANDLYKYILINSISTCASFLIFFIDIKKYVNLVPLNKLKLKKHFKGCIEFFIPLIATQIYSQLDKIMLGAITNDSFQNGYYDQSRKIVSTLMIITTSVNGVMYPRISRLFAERKDNEITALYESSMKLIWLLLVPIMFGVFLVSDNFVSWFFGQGYEQVSILMKLSVALLLFMTIGNFVGMQYLSPTGNQNKMTMIYIISAVFNTLFNIVLIPCMQSIGAIVASIAAEAISCFVQVFLLKRSKYNFKIIKGIWRYILASLIMGIGIILVDIVCPIKGVLLTFIEVIISVIIYFVILIILKEENVFSVLKKVGIIFKGNKI